MIRKSERTKLLGGPPVIPAVCDGPGTPGLVSVLIPTFNRAYILDKAIQSVLDQTYADLEVIVVDDGSTDNTREVLAQFGNRIRYIYQENAGLAVARNTGLAAATGEFVAFQDSDDLWLPWKVAAQVAVLRSNPEIALVWTDMRAISTDGEVIRERHLRTMYHCYASISVDEHMPVRGTLDQIHPGCPDSLRGVAYRSGDIFNAMFLGSLVHPPTALMRREHVRQAGGLDLTFSWTCEDYEFFTRVARGGWGALIEAPGMLYRVGAADQLTEPGSMIFVARGNLAVLRRRLHEDGSRLRGLPAKTIRRHLAEAYSWLAASEAASEYGSRLKALSYFGRSVALDPFQGRSLVWLAAHVTMPKPIITLLRAVKTRLPGRVLTYLIWLKIAPWLLDMPVTSGLDGV